MMHYSTTNNGSFGTLFHAICFIAAVILVGRCANIYYKDDDVSLVEYHDFHDSDEHIYPSISVCIKSPILGPPKWIERFGDEDMEASVNLTAKCWSNFYKSFGEKGKGSFGPFNQTKQPWSWLSKRAGKIRMNYLNLLEGKMFDEDCFEKTNMTIEDYFQIDYDDVTKGIEENLNTISMMLKSNGRINWKFINGSLQINEAHLMQKGLNSGIKVKTFDQNDVMKDEKEDLDNDALANIETPEMYISKRTRLQKCYSFNLPYISNEKIDEFQLYFKQDLFINERKEGKPYFNPSGDNKVSISFHYPHQTMKSLSTASGWQSKHKEVRSYRRKYYLANLEVLKRRNKDVYPCINGAYDENIIQNVIERIGCKHQGIKQNTETQFCKTRESFLSFYNMLHYPKKAPYPPCLGLRSMYEWHGEDSIGKKDGFWVRPKVIVDIKFTDDFYKRIVYIQDYTLESVIGNSGGYIGK